MKTLIRGALPGLIVVAASLASSGLAGADSIQMENGDRLTGKVLQVVDGKLSLETDYAGTLSISWTKVAALETERPIAVQLEDDQWLHGRLVPGPKGVLLIQEEGAPAPREVKLPAVSRLNQPGTVWSGSLTLSGKVEDGNTRSKTVALQAEFARESESTRMLLRGLYGYETKESLKTEDNYYVLGKLDLHLSKQSFAYVSDEMRRDEFENLSFRNVASIGLGYHFAKMDAFSLWMEAGPAYIMEEYSDGTNEGWFGGRVALHIRIQLPFGLEIRDDVTYYPNFETWGDWQAHNELSLSTRIGEGWHLSMSFITDWDNDPEAGRQAHDNKFLVGLGYRF